MIQEEITIYGIKNMKEEVEKIIHHLGLKELNFEIKLMLTETIMNAFEHGNQRNETKPICIRYKRDRESLLLEVQDCGKTEKNIQIPKELDEESLMRERGRGLYLINCFADEVDFVGNTIIIRKSICDCA